MDKTALVSLDLDRGREVLGALDGANLRVSVALWAFLSEYEDWRIILSARAFDVPDLRGAYRRLNDSLNAAGLTPDKAPPILILPMNDPFIKELRKLFARTRTVEGMRLGGQLIGGRFVQDAYVYRIS